jgi:AcrR family transcriptional regulator
MDLADASGLDSLTMRQLAGQLGVEAASLYNHVANKDEILDGMADLIVSEIDLPSQDAGWKESMRRRAVSARDVFSRHPWASGLVDSPERAGAARWEYSDRVLGVLLEAGFSPEMAMNAFLILDGYIYGFVRQSVNMSQGVETDSIEVAEQTLAVISPDLYPHLHDVIVESAMKVGFDEAGVFELGLELILEGLERRLEPRK